MEITANYGHMNQTFKKNKIWKISINNTLINYVIILPGVDIANEINIYPESVVHKSLHESGNYKSILISK